MYTHVSCDWLAGGTASVVSVPVVAAGVALVVVVVAADWEASAEAAAVDVVVLVGAVCVVVEVGVAVDDAAGGGFDAAGTDAGAAEAAGSAFGYK